MGLYAVSRLFVIFVRPSTPTASNPLEGYYHRQMAIHASEYTAAIALTTFEMLVNAPPSSHIVWL
jgi:hypothetical protein